MFSISAPLILMYSLCEALGGPYVSTMDCQKGNRSTPSSMRLVKVIHKNSYLIYSIIMRRITLPNMIKLKTLAVQRELMALHS